MSFVYQPDGSILNELLFDNSEVCITQGPIQSGKTLANLIRIGRHLREQKKAPDGWRKSRWFIVRNCYSADTEVLTENGWKFFPDLVEGERVAQLRDGVMEFVSPTYYYAAPYVGEMIGYEGEGVDFLVTPDHRMWVDRGAGFEFALARDVYGERVRVRRDCGWVGEDPGRSVAFFRWLGFWFAEGCAGVYECADGVTRYQCVIIQKKPEGVDLARRLFSEAGLECSISVRADGTSSLRLLTTPATKPLIEELATFGKATTKWAPRWVKNAPREHLAAFLDGFVLGDGHRRKGSTVAFTSSKQFADDLQEIALRAGIASNVYSRDRRGQAMCVNGVPTSTTAIEYTVSFFSAGRARPFLENKKPRNNYRRWYKERYAGAVYCIEVPTHLICVRRNGKAFWCSQTYPELESSTLKDWLETYPEGVFGTLKRSKPMTFDFQIDDVRAEVIFIALDVPDDIRKMRSTQFTGAYINELQFVHKAIFDELHSRAGRYPRVIDGGPSWSGVIADMNAPPPDHWIPLMRGEVPLPETMSADEARAYQWPKGWKFLKQPAGLIEEFGARGEVVGYRINPACENQKWMQNTYLKIAEGKSKVWIDSNIMNRVAVAVDGQPVWSSYKREVHDATEEIRPFDGEGLIVGLDFGMQPAAAVMQQVRGYWTVLAEVVGKDEYAKDFAPRLKRFLATKFPHHFNEGMISFYGDPAGDYAASAADRTPFEIFKAHGMMVRKAVDKDSAVMRHEAINDLFSQIRDGIPVIRINPDCRMIRAGAQGGYYFKRLPGTSSLKNEPEKNSYSHPCEAVEYAVIAGGAGRKMVGRAASPKARVYAVEESPMRRNRANRQPLRRRA